MIKTRIACACACACTPMAFAGGTWSEVGDAAELPGAAQVTVGIGPLSTITGLSDASIEDRDMFAIQITDPAAFSIDVTSTRLDGSGNDDSKIYLFDALGNGIAGDDDSSINGGSLDAGIPAGNALFAGLMPGLYYIAITDFNYQPTSAGGDIFPGGSLVGPTGPGAGSPITGWSSDSHELSWTYEIRLTGAGYAIVPTPSSAVCLVGAGLFAARRRR